MPRKDKIKEQKYLNQEQLKTLAKVSKDVFFFSTFCYVVNPVTGMVKFDLYPYQKSVLYQFLKERFNIILKFRQAGITELIAMYCLWLTMYHPNKKVNIISITIITTQEIFKYVVDGMDKNNKFVGHFESTGVVPKCCEKVKTNGVDMDNRWFFKE